VIYNGRSSPNLRPGPKEPFVLTAGRLWDEAKNVRTLLSCSDKIPCPIVLAGDGEADDLPANARSLGRLDGPTMADWMRRASVYAMPAKYEPFGLSILEAGMCGCALVLGDIPSLRELWHGAALFVDSDDSDALQDALCYLINHPRVSETLGSRARDRARRFSAEAFGRSTLFAYQDLKQAATAMQEAPAGIYML
jgi:glycogen synthase